MGLLWVSSPCFFLCGLIPDSTGIFFGVFQVNQVAGNLIGSFVLSKQGGNTHTLFFLFLGLALFGVRSGLISVWGIAISRPPDGLAHLPAHARSPQRL